MQTKKDFNLISKQVVSIVDFIKWTSSFSTGAICQMDTPVGGVKLTAQLNDLFALARDDIGWMLVLHEREGHWFSQFPFAEAFVGYNEGIILATCAVTALEQTYEPFGIDVFIPDLDLRNRIEAASLIGFGLFREPTQLVERVNNLIPVYTREAYEIRRIAKSSERSSRLFSQQ